MHKILPIQINNRDNFQSNNRTNSCKCMIKKAIQCRLLLGHSAIQWYRKENTKRDEKEESLESQSGAKM